MKIGKHALSLAAALAIGGANLSLTTGEAEARPRRPDNGARCSTMMHADPGEDITFYMPGQAHPRWEGWKCGPNGNWIGPPDGDTGATREPKGKGKGR